MNSPIRILVLCTGNSARSQIAEALLRARGGRRIEVESAGTEPSETVHSGARMVVERHGYSLEGQRPKQVEAVVDRGWDFVITVCDHARDACPVLPGNVRSAHWSVDDPAGASDEAQAFDRAYRILAQRVERLLALPLETLDAETVLAALQTIGETSPGG